MDFMPYLNQRALIAHSASMPSPTLSIPRARNRSSSRRTWNRSRYPIPRSRSASPSDMQATWEHRSITVRECRSGSTSGGRTFSRKASQALILAEGAVEILKGDFRINVVDEAGSIFGEVSVRLGIPPMATVRALERSRVFVAEDGLAFLSSRTDLALAVARLLARRLNSLTTYLADLKKQFEDQQSHLGIVDEVLETLVHDQSAAEDVTPGSDREPDPNADPT